MTPSRSAFGRAARRPQGACGCGARRSGHRPLVYVRALPLLARNPAIMVVPLLTMVVGVLLTLVLAPAGGGALGSATLGLGQLLLFLLGLFGLGSACILADGAWRRGRMPFDEAWTETQRRGGDILFAAVGVSLLLSVGQYVSQLFGVLGYLLMAAAVFFLIWAIPAAAVGGIPGGAAIQVSVERVRAAPLAAALVDHRHAGGRLLPQRRCWRLFLAGLLGHARRAESRARCCSRWCAPSRSATRRWS